MICVMVPGVPIGKARPRAASVGGRVRMYTPAKTAAAEAAISYAARAAGVRPSDGAISLTMQFVMPIPASWPKYRREAALDGCLLPTCKPDIDNLIKTVLDGLNGVAFADDRQVASLTALRIYGREPQTMIMICPMMAALQGHRQQHGRPRDPLDRREDRRR